MISSRTDLVRVLEKHPGFAHIGCARTVRVISLRSRRVLNLSPPSSAIKTPSARSFGRYLKWGVAKW
jgi:hypothetical protein